MAEADLARSIRRLQVGLGAVSVVALAAAGAAAFLWMREAPQSLEIAGELRAKSVFVAGELKVRSVVLADNDGRPLGRLAVDANGASLRLNAPTGKEIVYLGRHPAGGGNLTMRTDKGEQIVLLGDFQGHGGFAEFGRDKEQIAVHLGAGESPDAFLLVRNEAGKTLGYLGKNQHGDGSLAIDRGDGTELFHVSTDEKHLAYASLRGTNGKAGIGFDVDDLGGAMRIFDRDEKRVLYAGNTRGGSAHLKIFNASGGPLALIGSHQTKHGGCVATYSAEGKATTFLGPSQSRGHGLLSLFTKDGNQTLEASLDDKGRGGLVTVYDSNGKPVPGTPVWK